MFNFKKRGNKMVANNVKMDDLREKCREYVGFQVIMWIIYVCEKE